MKGKYGYGDSQWGPRNDCGWAEYIGGGRGMAEVGVGSKNIINVSIIYIYIYIYLYKSKKNLKIS